MDFDLDKPVTKKLDGIKVKGKAVSVRRLTLTAVAFLSDASEKEATAEDVARVVVHGLVYTKDGKRVYSDEQVAEVAEKDGVLLGRIFQEICDLYRGEEVKN